jgi:ribose-phosphate pyrophosphokinase
MKSIIFSVDGRTDLLNEVKQFLLKLEKLDNLTPNGVINAQVFSDGEVCVDFEESVRGKRVYLLCSPNDSDKIMQLNFAIDAAKRAAAREIIPIIPYFPYARQDKKDQTRGPIGAKVLAEMLENRGATQIVTFDLHADQIQGFFNIPVTHMEGKYLFDSQINTIVVDGDLEVVLCAPDAGAAKRVKHFRDQILSRYGIDLPIVMIDKTRIEANEVDSMVLIGNVTNKHVIIIDDMCDTGGTLVSGCDELLEQGAKKVSAIVTHGILSGPALERIANSKLEQFLCSDSLELNIFAEGSQHITQVTTGKQIAKAILAINNDRSIDALKHFD